MPDSAQSIADSYYFAVSPLLLFPQTRGRFGVYIKRDERFHLYAHADEDFTSEQRRKLYENGITEVYVLTRQRSQFNLYLEDNLGGILDDESLPMDERSRVFYDVSVSILRDAMSRRLPPSLAQERFERVLKFVTVASRFIAQGGSLKSLAKLISHDYQTYSHCVHVFVFSTAILQTYEWSDKDLVAAGMGAMLHDIGKIRIPREILNKPGKLDPQEWEVIKTHPMKGVAMCASVPLSPPAMNAILFHHERMDGKGYPSALTGPEIPLNVRAVSLADAYDALTSDRAYAAAVTPFEALRTIRDDMHGQYDNEVLKRLVMVLSGAEVI